MIRKTLFAAVAVLAAGPVFAQTTAPKDTADFTETVEYSTDKHKVVTNNFWGNWFISAGGGAQMYFGDHDRQLGFGEWISPALDVAVGKWFAPEFGMRLMYSGMNLRGATQFGVHDLGTDIKGKPQQGYWLHNSNFHYYHLHADAMLNLSNVIGGYKESRVYNISPYIGIGFMRAYDSPTASEFAFNGGIMNSFRITPCLDINLDIRGTMVNDRFDGEIGGRKEEGLLTASVGLTYKFKPRGWERSKTIIRKDNREANDLRDQIAALAAENAKLEKALAECNEKEAQTIIERVKVAAPVMITFQIGKSKLAKKDRVSLSFLAEVINSSNGDITYTITGYADAQTGSKAINERLSKERAEAVFNCLVNEYNVPAERLKVEYKGGVDNMFFDDPSLSRAAITISDR